MVPIIDLTKKGYRMTRTEREKGQGRRSVTIWLNESVKTYLEAAAALECRRNQSLFMENLILQHQAKIRRKAKNEPIMPTV